MEISNDLIILVLGFVGVCLLVFSYVWYQVTIKNHPEQDENIPLITFREMGDK